MSDTETGLVKPTESPYRAVVDVAALMRREMRKVRDTEDFHLLLRGLLHSLEATPVLALSRSQHARALFELRKGRDEIKRTAVDTEYLAGAVLGTCVLLAGWFVVRVQNGWAMLFVLSPIALEAHRRVRWAKTAAITVECCDALIAHLEKRLPAEDAPALLSDGDAASSIPGDPPK